MDDRNVVDAMHRLELIRRMRIQTMPVSYTHLTLPTNSRV